MDINVVLEHMFSKEQRTFVAESVREHSIDIHWPLSGAYVIDLRDGSIKSRSIKARRRNPYVLWRVQNLDEVKRLVWEKFHPNHDQIAKSIARHLDINNMPRPKTLSRSK